MFIKNLLSINKQSTLRISIVGGSNSVMRRGYAKYLDTYISKTSFRSTSLKYYSLGGVPNIYGAIQQDRHDIAAHSDLIFFEYCVNDRHAIEEKQYSLELVGKSIEGFIRKVKKSNPSCLIVILIFGINLSSFYDNNCHLSELYESIGEQYNLPVIDLTKVLIKSQGLDYVKSLYNDKDHAHYTRPEGVQIIAQT
ncbi:MAG: SGNH/GDSL hydrolase family protein, partial [Waterburya sp.]